MRRLATFTALVLLVGLGIYGAVTAFRRTSDRGPPESPRGAEPPSEVLPPSPDAADAQAPEDVMERFKLAQGGPLLLVPVRFAGKSLLFALDTGSSNAVFDSSLAPHLGNHGCMAVLQFSKTLLKQQGVFAHAPHEFRFGYDVEHGVTDRHRKRIAAERRPMRADGHPLGRFGRRKARPDRESAAERFRKRHNVGLNAATLIGKHLARAHKACLYLVEHKQEPMLVAKLAQCAQERWRCDPHAAFALDRLDEDRGRRGTNRTLDRLEVAKRDLVEPIDRRPEAFKIFLVSGCRDRGKGPPVEGSFEGDDAITFGPSRRRLILAQHLDRALDRLGTRVLKEHGIGKADLAQPVREPLALRNAIEV